ncbi:MAG: hypothetical protein JO282_13970, partial [Alphaproteobacteria bacterium]|nr:hypothetical protein [Alphaproteobacteria bacterium]
MSSLPPYDEVSSDETWLSLLRAVRAPLAVLLIAALGLLVPPQTADMLAALGGGRLGGVNFTVTFHLSLASLSFSTWYWARALLAARLDIADNLASRNMLPLGSPGGRSVPPAPPPGSPPPSRPTTDRRAYDAIPRVIAFLSLLLGIGLIARSHEWFNLIYLALWGVPFLLLTMFRLRLCAFISGPGVRMGGAPLAATTNFFLWIRSLWPRLQQLILRAPISPTIAIVLLALSLVAFAYGTVESYVAWDGEAGRSSHEGLPAIVASWFPGPGAALIGLGLIIAPLSAITFLADGLELDIRIYGMRLGPRHVPAITALVAWILIAPAVFYLHTVRVASRPENAIPVEQRAPLDSFFSDWVAYCAPDGGPLRPVIVAISGGASRAAIWGERVLLEVERWTAPGTPSVFAVSSVSGGSLGAAAYMSLLAGLAPEQRCSKTSRAARAKQMEFLASPLLAEDALGPLLAGSLLVDTPRALFSPVAALVRGGSNKLPRGGDRAEALERAFEALWRRLPGPPSDPPRVDFGEPFLSLFYDQKLIRHRMPLWIANGTDVTTGGRVITVPFNPRGGWPFLGGADVLSAIAADVPISTAINNTARFPYLEPAGELLRFSAIGAAEAAVTMASGAAE